MKIKGFDGNYDGDCDKCPVQECFDKLAEYEKTGITPGQIREMSKMYEELATELGRYKKAEEQGLLIMLPCKEGDTVYSIEADCGGDILDCRRRDCENCDYLIRHVSEIRFGIEMREEIGKTVFLTREEAEKALKEMEG